MRDEWYVQIISKYYCYCVTNKQCCTIFMQECNRRAENNCNFIILCTKMFYVYTQSPSPPTHTHKLFGPSTVRNPDPIIKHFFVIKSCCYIDAEDVQFYWVPSNLVHFGISKVFTIPRIRLSNCSTKFSLSYRLIIIKRHHERTKFEFAKLFLIFRVSMCIYYVIFLGLLTVRAPGP